MKRRKIRQKSQIIKVSSSWFYPSKHNPRDDLKVRFLMDEKIKGNRIIGLEARIDPGKIHRLHFHDNEFVIVYSLIGKCKVTIGNSTKIIFPKTLVFIPPKVPRSFENIFRKKWEGVAFVIGKRSKIKNIWIEK